MMYAKWGDHSIIWWCVTMLIAVDEKRNLLYTTNAFQQQCAWVLCRIWYIYSVFKRKLIIWWLWFTCPMCLVWCDTAVKQIHYPQLLCIQQVSQQLQSSNTIITRRRIIEIHLDMYIDHVSNMVNTHWIYNKSWIYRKKLFNKNRLQPHVQQFHPVLIDERLLPKRNL